MANSSGIKAFLLLFSLLLATAFHGQTSRLDDFNQWESTIKLPSEKEDEIGTRWAILVAGSSGYGNYRHQADVCHAYQLLKKGGLKEENIVVFMYDDIATSELNPRAGIIINHPQGQDVYSPRANFNRLRERNFLGEKHLGFFIILPSFINKAKLHLRFDFKLGVGIPPLPNNILV